MPEPSREKLGSFFVDSGCILAGDPCQFVNDEGEAPNLTYRQLVEMFHEQGRSYVEPAVVVAGEEVIPASERRERAAVVKVPAPGGGTAGLVVTVGCDGWYPVFLEKGADGEPLRLIIELGGQVEP